jgi:hypothetical protein
MTEAIFSGVTSTIMQALVSIDTLIVDQVIFPCKPALRHQGQMNRAEAADLAPVFRTPYLLLLDFWVFTAVAI